jgi:hypothetical protein
MNSTAAAPAAASAAGWPPSRSNCWLRDPTAFTLRANIAPNRTTRAANRPRRTQTLRGQPTNRGMKVASTPSRQSLAAKREDKPVA